MPANLTPDYKKAEERFREATTNEEKILCLEQMLRLVPKHKGTDHLRADLRRKLSKLKEAPTQKGAGSHQDIFHVPRTGAGQVVLLGLPNGGKSALVGALSKAKVHIADFPFTTQVPCPGMIKYEDVQIQLVDMPPITRDYVAPGQVGTYRNGDLIGVVIDLSTDIDEQWRVCLDYLETKSLLAPENAMVMDDRGNHLAKPVVCIGTKVDLAGAGLLELLAETCPYPMTFLEVSAETGAGMDTFVRRVFEMLRILRVYAKPPGKPADMNDPFTLPIGANIHDMARVIHRELAGKLKTARMWGEGVYDGQYVHLDHVLHDRDVVELHFS